MRDDLFCFAFMGHRVCVSFDDNNIAGWSFTIDSCETPGVMENLTWSQRLLLEEAGMVARDRIRAVRSCNTVCPSGGAQLLTA